MLNSPNYKNIEFTKHAHERMQLRVITEDMVVKAIRKPDKTYLEDDGDTKFIRKVDGANLQVICKPLPDEDKWLVKSAWVRGEDDYGNRVDRQGHYLGKRKRVAPPVKAKPATPRPVLNWVLIAVLITLVAIVDPVCGTEAPLIARALSVDNR
ncbi:MAG: DUF4258 domain-containing protein [Anaerolineae bacterium]